jgi:hypothetical protein
LKKEINFMQKNSYNNKRKAFTQSSENKNPNMDQISEVMAS